MANKKEKKHKKKKHKKEKGEKKKRRKSHWKKEINFFQKKYHGTIVPRAAFIRVIKSVEGAEQVRWSADALKALQEGAEAELVNIFNSANILSMARKSKTIKPKDCLNSSNAIRSYSEGVTTKDIKFDGFDAVPLMEKE